MFSLFATLESDTTPPTVIAITPADGLTGVSTVTDMMAAFSEPIDPATLTTSSFVLRDLAGVTVGATVGYGEATRVATLTPSAPLAGLTTYTATISTAVKDVAGNALANPFVWSFTTAAARWAHLCCQAGAIGAARRGDDLQRDGQHAGEGLCRQHAGQSCRLVVHDRQRPNTIRQELSLERGGRAGNRPGSRTGMAGQQRGIELTRSCYDTVNNDTCDTSWLDAGT